MDGTELENQIDTETTFDPGNPGHVEGEQPPVEGQPEPTGEEAPPEEGEAPTDPLLEREAKWQQEREHLMGAIDRLHGMVERQAQPKQEPEQEAGIVEFAREYFDDDTASRLGKFMEAYESRLGKRFVPNERFQQYEGAVQHMGLNMAEQRATSEFTRMGYSQNDVQTALQRVQQAARNGETVGNTRRALASELAFMEHEKKQKAAQGQVQARQRKVEARPKNDMRGISANATGPEIPLPQNEIDKMSDRDFLGYLAQLKKPSGE